METPKLSTTSVYRRLAQVLLSLILLVAILYKWVSADLQATSLIHENTKALIDKLVSHTATQASHLIKPKASNKEQQQLKARLSQLLDDLSNDPHIEQAMVYDEYGATITSSKGANSATNKLKEQLFPPDAYTPFNIEQDTVKSQSLMVVHEIRKQDILLGYIRVNYYHELLVLPIAPAQRSIMEEILLMVLLSAVMGFLLTRGFARFSRNTFRMDNSDSK